MSVIGDAWTLLIIRELFLGSRRYDDFLAYTGMAPKLLSAKLKRLDEAGIVKRVLYSEKPKRYEYRLTQMGMDLHPIIVSVAQWGDTWMKRPGERVSPLKLTHTACGHTLGASFVCSCCGKPVDPREVDVAQSRALRAERAEMREMFHSSKDKSRDPA